MPDDYRFLLFGDERVVDEPLAEKVGDILYIDMRNIVEVGL